MYSTVDPGTKVYRSRLKLNYSHDRDIDFGKAYPLFWMYVLPGDVLKISSRVFIRYQPTLAPILNGCKARVRYFYVPNRQVEKDFETIVTGSLQGQVVSDTPVMHNFVEDVTDDDNFVVSKGKFWDVIGIPCLNYKTIKNDRCLPARYWYKGYKKIEWDYYKDENINTEMDFEQWFDTNYAKIGGQADLFSPNLRKDYFTSATPFELKGTIPTFDVEVSEPFIDGQRIQDFTMYNDTQKASGVTSIYGDLVNVAGSDTYVARASQDNRHLRYNETAVATGLTGVADQVYPFRFGISTDELNDNWSGFSGSFNMRDIRRMSALTRIKERDMRCGSRYTEYLRANFHTAPADETLQRPVYLGGFIQPIITNEVLQTGTDTTYPVGTLRGKGISDGANGIRTFKSKEFGMIFGIVDVIPDIIYTQGIERQLTYISRYDFFNPSFQNLSEQEIRNGEIFVSTSDGKNDDTFGFQGMYNELRSRRNIVTGDLRDGLKYWTQAIEFANRPNWGENFLKSSSYDSSFKRPFAVNNAEPMIIHMDNVVDAYRPMIKEPVPGLVDHH